MRWPWFQLRERGKEGGEKEAHVRSVRPDQFKASLIALTSLASRDREGESPRQMESKDLISESALELDILGRVFKPN